MATSIPYDPSLVLGSIVPKEKFEDLMEIANAQQPLNLVQQKLNAILETTYSLKNIEHEMENIGVDWKAMQRYRSDLEEMERSVVAAALEYGQTAAAVYTKVEELQNAQDQKTISYSIESPLDYGKSEITKFPISYDAIEMDVQYYRNEINFQSSGASSGTGNSILNARASMGYFGGSKASENVNNSMATALEQSQKEQVEGTVVISCRATHKNADLLSPFVIDPIKAVSAWNYTYPSDIIEFDYKSLMTAALADYTTTPDKKNSIDIISGCTKSSSFTGFVHILKEESTRSSQSANSQVESIRESVESSIWFSSSVQSGFGGGVNSSGTGKNSGSKSFIQNHVNICCQGIIPSIVMNEMASTVKTLQPSSEDVMNQQASISEAGNEGQNSNTQSKIETGRKGVKFMNLNSEYMKNTVSNLGQHESQQNKVIDTNSMMTALEDFIVKAESGEGGIPTNFYIKALTKNDIAKQYIKKFYPNGIIGTSAKERLQGLIGLSTSDE